MQEITKEEIEAIYEEICTECDNGDGLTTYGSYCVSLLQEVVWGGKPVVYDSGLNYFGLEKWLEFRID